MRPQKFPDIPVSLEGNTEGPGTTSSEPLLPSSSRQESRFPCFVWKGFPTFPAHFRMRPVSPEIRDVASLVVPHAERPRFADPLLIRTRCQDTSSKANLWTKSQHEGALTPPCSFWKNPQVPHTARHVASHPVNNMKGKQSSAGSRHIAY